MLAKLLKRAGVGFLLGAVAPNLILWLAEGIPVSSALVERVGSESAALALQALGSGLYGVATMSGTLLYDMERCPLALATGLHCLIVALPYIPLSLLLGWNDSFTEILIAECFQVAGFFLVWLFIYLRGKAEVRKLNELNHSRKEK